jgi:hypothetical protein
MTGWLLVAWPEEDVPAVGLLASAVSGTACKHAELSHFSIRLVKQQPVTASIVSVASVLLAGAFDLYLGGAAHAL